MAIILLACDQMSIDEPTPDDAFAKLLQQYRNAVNDDNLGEAVSAVHEIFAAAFDWCNQNPSPILDLTIAGDECEENSDWVGAESQFRQILALPSLEPHAESKAHLDLSGIYGLVNRPSDALQHARLATAAARRSDTSTLLTIMLQCEVGCLIRCDQCESAREVIEEALAVIDDDKLHDQLRASFLTSRADSVYSKVEVANRLKGLADALASSGHADSAAAALAERTAILNAVGVPDAEVE